MEIQSNKMGRVRPVPEGEHNAEREYRMLSIVYSKDTNKSYISKKDVPAGINIDNKIYWQVFGNGKFVDNAIINVSYLEDSIVPHTLAEAISMVDEEDRRPGIVLAFFEKESDYNEGNAWILYQFKGSSVDDWDKQQYWVSVYNRENKFKGWFLNSTELVERWPNPFKGDYAYVGQSLNNSWIWRCNDDGTWSRTSERFSSNAIINYYGDINNNPDFEDIDVDEQNRLKFANREPNENEMGYVILRKDKTFAEQVTKENTIYEIRYNFNLDENVTIPENCILKFEGGSISGNSTLIGNNTSIKAGLVKIFNIDITLAGTWNIIKVYPEWFGAKGDDGTDCTQALQKAIDFCISKSEYDYNRTIFLSDGIYIITSPLLINSGKFASTFRTGLTFKGTGRTSSVLKAGEEMDFMIKGSFTENDYNCVEFSDFSLDGNAYGATPLSQAKAKGGISLHCIYSLLYNLRFWAIDGIAIENKYSYNVIIKNIIVDKAKCGLKIYGVINATGIKDSAFLNISEYGIAIEGGRNISIEHNTFEIIGRTALILNKLSNYSVIDNYFEACSTEGFHLYGINTWANNDFGTVKSSIIIGAQDIPADASVIVVGNTGYNPYITFKNNTFQLSSGEVPICAGAISGGDVSYNYTDDTVPLIFVPYHNRSLIMNVSIGYNFKRMTLTPLSKFELIKNSNYGIYFFNIFEKINYIDKLGIDLPGNLCRYLYAYPATDGLESIYEQYNEKTIFVPLTTENNVLLQLRLMSNISNNIRDILTNSILTAEYDIYTNGNWITRYLTLIAGYGEITINKNEKFTLPRISILGELTSSLKGSVPYFDYNFDKLYNLVVPNYNNIKIKLVGSDSIDSIININGNICYKALNSIITVGDTTNRPILSSNLKGFKYFDETLNKPIWWNGSAWVDATGQTV